MKRLLLGVMLLSTAITSSLAEEVKRKPENLTMTLAIIADAGEPRQYVFVVNGVVAYKSIDGLKNYLKDVPVGSTLTWSPGCCRTGGEPLLSSEQEMTKFKEFCKSIDLKFVLVPSG